MSILNIPEELINEFTLNGKIPVIDYYLNDTVSVTRHFKYDQYEIVINKLKNNEFEYYGKTLDYLLEAINKYSIKELTVVIFGLASINCDAIAIWKGSSMIYVLEYNLPISEHPLVTPITYIDYFNSNIQVDIGISISSFEHDGLGRYGDPINPNGDIEAMQIAKKIIKKNGLLFLAVPIGLDCLAWNAHRIYGEIRLPMLLEGWEILDTFGFNQNMLKEGEIGGLQQPIFVLKNL